MHIFLVSRKFFASSVALTPQCFRVVLLPTRDRSKFTLKLDRGFQSDSSRKLGARSFQSKVQVTPQHAENKSMEKNVLLHNNNFGI